MKSGHERSNECLPPKKREIPPSTLPSESRSPTAPPWAGEPRPPDNAAWLAGGGSAAVAAPRDQSLYSASDSVRSLSSLRPLSQTRVGGTVRLTQVPADVQFIGSPYAAPYAGYVAPRLLPPPPPHSAASSQRLASPSEAHAASSQAASSQAASSQAASSRAASSQAASSRAASSQASIRYTSAMPPPPQGVHRTDAGSAQREEGGAGSRELHNGGPEGSRRPGPPAGKWREACQLLLPTDYAHEPLTLRASVMLTPDSRGGRRPPPSRGGPGKGAVLPGKPLDRGPWSADLPLTCPPPLSGDNLKAALSPPSPQTVIQATHDSTAEALSAGLPAGGVFPQPAVIAYVAGAGGSQHAPISYRAGLRQHVLEAGARPVLIPVGAGGAETSSARASYRRLTSGAAARARLRLPAAPDPPSGTAETAAPPSLPPYFVKGSIIQLADGELKRVEELKTEDFIQSAEISGELKIDSSTVERIDGSRSSPDFAVVRFSVGEHRSQVSVEVLAEYPFFVFGQGWSSCCPDRTTQLLELPCAKLSVGDVCISLTLKNLRNGSLPKTGSPEPRREPRREPRQPSSAPYLLGAAETACGELENGRVAVENGDLAFGERGPHLKERGAGGRKRRWSAPEGRKAENPEEPPLTLAKPTFIPQEVKVTIEGPSNVGK